MDSSPLPGLLRLPWELRSRILLDVITDAQSNHTSDYHQCDGAFPLHRGVSQGAEVARPKNNSILIGIICSCRSLQQDSLALLADKFIFYIHIDVSDEALSRVNHFRLIHNLNPTFRHRINKLSILVSFLAPKFNWDKFIHDMNDDKNPLMYEKIIENLNEILHLLPAVTVVDFVWGMGFGNSGTCQRLESYARGVWRRMGEEWPNREIMWTGQHCMGKFDKANNGGGWRGEWGRRRRH